MIVPKVHKSEKSQSFLTPHRGDLIVVAIWVVSLIPGFLISIFKQDPFYASVITVVIQFMASFGSITLFGVISQLICYRYIESTDVHDRMMDGLFYGFHGGMVAWILYAFYHILFGMRTVGEINSLIGFFGITCVLSCIVGLICGFLVGRVEESKRARKF
uniref:Uncharacterized protein n=1 Tax=Fundidesulfovibrio putealis TaxID=270496 RepID=A0A7C4AHK7_9BACT